MSEDISLLLSRLNELRNLMNHSNKELLNCVEDFIVSIERQKNLNTIFESQKLLKDLEQEKEKNRDLEGEIQTLKNDFLKKVKEVEKLELELAIYKKKPDSSTTDPGNLPGEVDRTHDMAKFMRFDIRTSIVPGSKYKLENHWGSIERKQGIEHIRNFVEGAKELIITDPFFYCGGSSDEENEEYLNDIKQIINPSTINKLHIITNPKKQTEVIRDEIHKIYGKKLTEAFTFDIHDRIWIVDSTKASLLGTSLNGIGNKVAFFLPLPYQDLEGMKEELKKGKLLNDRKRKRRMTLRKLTLDEFISYISDESVWSQYLIGK